MKLSAEEFRQLKHKNITLLGMSGVGKTYLSNMLAKAGWFHYSGDYRIGKHYLNDEILNNIKQQVMEIPFVRDLLESDSITIENNITIDHLKPISTFLGKLGNPELGGLPLDEYKRRQDLHRESEIQAMKEVPDFIAKARAEGFDHFINDAGGSLCEMDDDQMYGVLEQHTIFLYLKATEAEEQVLIDRAAASPKPMYHREEYLDEQLSLYLEERGLDYIALIEPDDFVRWMFPRLFNSRLPRYQGLADKYGYTVGTTELHQVRDDKDFVELIADVIAADQAGEG